MADMDNLAIDRSNLPRLRPGVPRSGAGPVRFSLDEVPARDRLAVYRDFFGRSVCRFEIDPLDGIRFDVDVMLHSLPGLQLFTGKVQGARCGRPPSLLGDGTDGLALVVNLAGPYLASQLGKEFVLDDGEATLVSEADPFFLTHHPPGGLLVLRVPRALLAPLVTRPEDRILNRIPSETSALRLLRSYVALAWSEPGIEDQAIRQSVATHLHELLALAVGAAPDSEAAAIGRGMRAARLHAIKKDIAENLNQASLSVAEIARRHACTPRFVQRLFEAEGTTLTEYVLDQRLARAHRLLTDPRRAGEKIGAIALDAGFSDLSYFNRAFRRRFGDTPSGVRAEATKMRS
ncbi:MAG TPA: helix-turn-helix domain-containing protein [Bauldia sp.]|nr:helix-turn-helix domain-containing protein [Bauldia sp.]